MERRRLFGSTIFPDNLSNSSGQIFSFSTSAGLSIDSDSIFGTGSSGKRPSILVLCDDLFNVLLGSSRGCKFAFCGALDGGEKVSVCDFDTDETVGEICVGLEPLGAGEALVCKNDFYQEHV